jgi:exonuclease III
MERARRETGKPVVLVGDLNIARRPQDSFFKDRLVPVESFLKSPPPPGLENLWNDLTRVWGDVVERLGNRQARKQTTYAPSQVLLIFGIPLYMCHSP